MPDCHHNHSALCFFSLLVFLGLKMQHIQTQTINNGEKDRNLDFVNQIFNMFK